MNVGEMAKTVIKKAVKRINPNNKICMVSIFIFLISISIVS